MPCVDKLWLPLWAEVENSGAQRETVSPPSVPFMEKRNN